MTNAIKEKLGLTMTEAITTAEDREKWKNIVYAATAFQEAECSSSIVISNHLYGALFASLLQYYCSC